MTTGTEPQSGAAGDESLLRCSIPEAARRLGISERSIHKGIQKGILTAEREGEEWVVILPSPMLPGETALDQDDNTRTTQPLVAPTEPGQTRRPSEIQQAIDRLGARHSTRVRALSEQIHHDAEAAGSEHTVAPHPTSPFERQLDALPASHHYADTEQVESVDAAEPTSIESHPPVESAEREHGVPADQTDAFDQQWQAFFTGQSNAVEPPASSPTPRTDQPAPFGGVEHRRQLLAGLRQVPQSLAERVSEWRDGRFSPYSYRTRIVVAMIGVVLLIAVLLGLGVVFLLNPPSGGWTSEPLIGSIASSEQRAATSTAQAQPTSAPTQALLDPATGAAEAAPTAGIASNLTAAPAVEAPTEQAVNSPTVAPTVPAAPSTNTPLSSAAVILQRVAAAEAALHRGQIEATITNADGTGAWAQLRFDLGDATQPPAFHMTSIYTGTAGAQRVERITIGDRSWERQPDGRWNARPAQEAVMDQLQVFMPHADRLDATTIDNADSTALRWHDPDNDTDVTLVVDPATGIPQELRRVTRATGAVHVISYKQWNTAVDIKPPDEN